MSDMRRTIRPRLAAAVASGLLCVFLAAGCGDDDANGDNAQGETSSAASSVPSPDEGTETPDAPEQGTDGPGTPSEGTEEPPSELPRPSREAFLRDANRICVKAAAKLEAIAERVDFNAPAEYNKYVREQLVPGVRAQLDDIRALGVPRGDDDRLAALLAETESLLTRIDRNPDLLVGGDAFASLRPKLNAYGLDSCSPS